MIIEIFKEIKTVRKLSYEQYELSLERYRMLQFLGEGKTIYYDDVPKKLEDLTDSELKKFYEFDNYDESIKFHNMCSQRSENFVYKVNDQIDYLEENLEYEQTLISLLKTSIAFILFVAAILFVITIITQEALPTILSTILLLAAAGLGYLFHTIECILWHYLIVRCEQFIEAEEIVRNETFKLFLEKINSKN